ncbi:MAG: lysine N(6)-hydroxylase/L-ornithine N(5)-oxygenase family protein [Candidatus Phlomobacter fragariae]
MTTRIYDFIAIGIGPFNLGLACLVQPIKEINSLFIDQSAAFDWHPGMMLENSSMQTPFIADLVTLASPGHPLSFLNYIKQKGHIYSFYIRESFFLMRKEYNQYCQWATEQLSNLRFNTRVENISYDLSRDCYTLYCVDSVTGQSDQFCCKKLVLGTGPSLYIPKCCQPFSNQMVRSDNYLENKASLQQKKSITIIGSGQSAAEIFYDLLGQIDIYGYQLNWITRSPRFFPLEYSKLTLEMTSPEYVDYFYNLSGSKRDELNSTQKSLYKGINIALINDIFDLMYTKRLNGKLDVALHTNSELQQVQYDREKQQLVLDLFQQEQQASFSLASEGVVLATGYQYQIPKFINGICDQIRRDEQGRYDVRRNYSIDYHNSIFVQNAEYHTHGGVITPDLGMACYRNSYLIKEITGKEYYAIENSIAFQQFGVAQEGVNKCLL